MATDAKEASIATVTEIPEEWQADNIFISPRTPKQTFGMKSQDLSNCNN